MRLNPMRLNPMRLTGDDRRVLDALAARGDALVGRAVEWCATNSGSRNGPGLEAQRKALAEVLGRLPGVVESVALTVSVEIGADGAPRLQPHPDALRLTVRPEAQTQVVLTGHYDTVYPAESAFHSVRPRPDGALNGPGIADMKGGISIMLGALEAFETHPLAERVGYRVLLSPDEEIGSPASAPLLAELAAGGHIGMTYEPCMPDGALAGARKGSGNFHIVVKGRAAHAGRDFASGRNAVAGAAGIAATLHGLNGLREGVTVNIGRIDGGGPLNVVPDTAVLRFNVRVPDGAAAEWASAQIEAARAAVMLQDLETALYGGFTRPPKPLDGPQERLLEAAREVGALIGQAITWRSSGGVCEGNNLYAAGLPNIDTLGVRGGDIHSEDEYAWPESFAERACLSTALLMKIASGDVDAPAIRAASGPAAADRGSPPT
jgi:glutamate carboxypeptidase